MLRFFTVLLIILTSLFGCSSTIKFSMDLPTPEKPGVRGFLELNKFAFLSLSDTETITGFIGFKHQNDLCKALNGTLYVYKSQIVETYGGRKLVKVEKEYEKTGTLELTELSMNTSCRKGDEVIFSVDSVTETGRYGTATCRVSFISHKNEKIMDLGYEWVEVTKNIDLPLEVFLEKVVGAKKLHDGNYKIGPVSENRCSPITFPNQVSKLATYCSLKGGVVKTSQGNYKDFVKAIVKDSNWIKEMLKAEYYCEGATPFTIRVEEVPSITSTNIAYNIPRIGIAYYIKPEATSSEVKTTEPSSPVEENPTVLSNQMSVDPLEALIIRTAIEKAPQVLNQGAMVYKTTYNYSEGPCDYVSLTMEVEGLGTEKTLNYRVCGGRVEPLGEEKDYFRGAPEVVYLKAQQLKKSCSLYGKATTTVNGFRIDCRVLNPNRPCIVETTITHRGKLLKQDVSNACQ